MSRRALGLLLVDHGSRRAEANAQLDIVAGHLRALRPGALVAVAHMELAAPDIAQAVAALAAGGAEELVVLPYFLSDGRHLTEDIPRLVAAAAAGHPQLTVRIGRPLGPHPALAALALERAGLDAVVVEPDGR